MQWFFTYLHSEKRSSFPRKLGSSSDSPSGLVRDLDQGRRTYQRTTPSSPSLLYLLPLSSAARRLIPCSANCHHYAVFPSFTRD